MGPPSFKSLSVSSSDISKLLFYPFSSVAEGFSKTRRQCGAVGIEVTWNLEAGVPVSSPGSGCIALGRSLTFSEGLFPYLSGEGY